jgi:hypothetical protein
MACKIEANGSLSYRDSSTIIESWKKVISNREALLASSLAHNAKSQAILHESLILIVS